MKQPIAQPDDSSDDLVLASSHPLEIIEKPDTVAEEACLERAVRTLADTNPRAIFTSEVLWRIEKKQYGLGILRRAAVNDPCSAVKAASRHPFDVYSQDIFSSAAAAATSGSRREWLFEHILSELELKNEICEAIWRIAAVESPASVLHLWNKIKDTTYAREVLECAVKKVAIREPLLALDSITLYKDEPYAEESFENAVLHGLVEATEEVAYSVPEPNHDKREMLIKLADKDPHLVLLLALRHSQVFHDAPDLLRHCLPPLMSSDKVSTLALVEKYPENFLSIEFVADSALAKFREEILERAARSLATMSPESILEKLPLIEDKPYAREILVMALMSRIIDDNDYTEDYSKRHQLDIAIFQHCDVLTRYPYGREILLIAARNWPATTVFNAKNFSHVPYAKEILEIAAYALLAKRPDLLFSEFEVFKDLPCIATILRHAIKKAANAALKHKSSYEAQPWGSEIVKLALASLEHVDNKK